MLKRVRKIFIKVLVCFIVLSVSWVVLYRSVPVKWTPLMLKRSIENIEVEG